MASLVAAPSSGDAAPAVKGCGKSCLGSCCLPNSALPLYGYASLAPVAPWAKRGSTTDLSTCSSTGQLEDTTSGESSGSDESSEGGEPAREGQRSFLDSLILSLWDERAEEGLFRYDVTACETKLIPGKMGFVAQYNEGRHSKKRPTEFTMDAVMQPYDSARFNFTKVGQREALFAFEEACSLPDLGPGAGSSAVYLEDAPLGSIKVAEGPNIVAINVSPIEYGHVLLIPRVHGRYAQRMDATSLLLALRFAAEVDNPHFRLGYNSLGAFATVNHLHFQGYYTKRPFAIECATVSEPLWMSGEGGGTAISELQGYPVRGLVFSVGESRKEMADVLAAACAALQARNLPFNIFISGSGSRAFLFPQCYAERQAKGDVEAELLETQVNPAVFEISGHMVMKRREDFEEITEDLACRLLAAVSLSAEEFQSVKDMCLREASSVQN